MSDIKNVTKQVQSVSPYVKSKNSSILKNAVDKSINGTPSINQSLKSIALNTTDFKDINQAQSQDGFFVSITDKYPRYDLPANIKHQNIIKNLEVKVGVPYSYESIQAAREKAQIVKQDFTRKNLTFELNRDSSIKDKIEAIENDYTNINREWGKPNLKNKYTKAEIKRDLLVKTKGEYDLRAGKGSVGYSSKENMNYSVVLEEARSGSRSYKLEGEADTFSEEIVKVCILSNVQNFSFGTTQNFDPVEPRGSQSPLYFYNKNPGRTLSFSAEFYQQEYPTEPLLFIAEKAQYLCRPYRHGDYSVIPKLIKVTIPGRVFMGYLNAANVSYSADMGDYRSWSLGSVRVDDTGSLGNNIATSFSGNLEGSYNSVEKETLNYGLGKMSIDFSLLIVEEIKLTLYETQAEIQARKEKELEDQKRRLLEEKLDEAQKFINEAGITEYKASDLVLVNQDGEFVRFRFDPATREILYTEPDSMPFGLETYTQYQENELLKKENSKSLEVMKSNNSDLFETPDSVMEAMNISESGVSNQTKNDLIQYILKIQGTGEGYTEEDLRSKSVNELISIRNTEIKNISESQDSLVDVLSDFSYAKEKEENGQKIWREDTYIPKRLRELFKRSSNNDASLLDLSSFISEYFLSDGTYSVNKSFLQFQKSSNFMRPYTDTFNYGYINLLLFPDIKNTYSVQTPMENRDVTEVSLDIFGIVSDVLSGSYRIWIADNFTTERYLSLNTIRSKDFIDAISSYKDSTGKEDTTLVKFFIQFYKNILKHNIEFYNKGKVSALNNYNLTHYFSSIAKAIAEGFEGDYVYILSA